MSDEKKQEAEKALKEAHKNAYGDHSGRDKAVREYQKERGK